MVVTSQEKRTVRPAGVPPVEDVTRRGFLIGAAGLVILAPYGCSDGGERAADEAKSGQTRRFEDDTGEAVRITVRPRRIVALDDRTLEAALAVEAPVVGAVGRYKDRAVPEDFGGSPRA